MRLHFCKVALGFQNDKLFELKKTFEVSLSLTFLTKKLKVEGIDQLLKPHRLLVAGLVLRSPELQHIVLFCCGPISRIPQK